MSKTNGQKPLLHLLSDDVTLVAVAGKKFELHEMSIGRAREFALRIVKAFDALRGGLDAETTVEQALLELGDELFTTITELWNYLFEYRCDKYKPIDSAWVEENLSIRQLTEIIKEVARLNRMDWLFPFFKGEMLKRMASPLTEPAQTSTQPITS